MPNNASADALARAAELDVVWRQASRVFDERRIKWNPTHLGGAQRGVVHGYCSSRPYSYPACAMVQSDLQPGSLLSWSLETTQAKVPS
jgi:hypothetical protein